MRAALASVLIAGSVVLLAGAGALAVAGRFWTGEALVATAAAAVLGLLAWSLGRPAGWRRTLGIGVAAGCVVVGGLLASAFALAGRLVVDVVQTSEPPAGASLALDGKPVRPLSGGTERVVLEDVRFASLQLDCTDEAGRHIRDIAYLAGQTFAYVRVRLDGCRVGKVVQREPI